jgi:hypothetical protein
LSASGRSGRVRGRPAPERAMRNAAISGSNASESWRWPAVVTRASGRHRASAIRGIFVVSPPRERPSPSRSRPDSLVAEELLSFDSAPSVGRGDNLVEHRDQPVGIDIDRRGMSAPAACACARTIVASIPTTHSPPPRAAAPWWALARNPSNVAAQVPSADQRRCRL